MAVGSAFLIVGAAVIVGLLNPGYDPSVERSGSGEVPLLPAGDWRPLCFPATASGAAALSLSWSASSLVNVSLYAVSPPCPTATVSGPPLWTWQDAIGGSKAATVPTASWYELVVTAPGGSGPPVNFTASLNERYRIGTLTLPLVPFLLTMVGASMLAGMGAVALYLGLFLPSGVFSPLEGEPTPPDDEVGPPPGAPPVRPPG
jgi:hypothetical protein